VEPVTAIVALITAITGTVGAVGVLIRYVVRELRRDRQASVEAMSAQQASFTLFLTNHMSSNTKAMENVAVALTSLKDEVAAMRAEYRYTEVAKGRSRVRQPHS
jgi:hypothetical protein